MASHSALSFALEAIAHVDHGWQNVQLDPFTRSILYRNRATMELDPGGIGKGYAVDRVIALLREQRVTAALISAGSSSIYAIGAPPGSSGWRVNIPDFRLMAKAA